MLLYDFSHTSHSRARTGVQRVALELHRALQQLPQAVQEITYDPHSRSWRPLRNWELQSLVAPAQATKRRGAYWPWPAQLRGYLDRFRRSNQSTFPLPQNPTGFFTPEIFTQRTAQMLPSLFRQLSCPKVALFHDAISLRMPDLAPASAVGRFPAYLAELHGFDGVVAVSEDSCQSLIGYWDWAGWKNHPPVMVSSLGLDHLIPESLSTPDRTPSSVNDAPPTILCVGSIEGRKNHLTLLNACEQLWRRGLQFNLRLIGSLQRETGRAAKDRLEVLQRENRPITYDGWISDQDLQNAYAESAFTVYPSLLEGFGLPVWESLIHARPCICSAEGATGETASGGGCLTTDPRSTESLAQAIQTLLEDADLRQRLTSEASQRLPPRWSACAQRLIDWMAELPSSNAN